MLPTDIFHVGFLVEDLEAASGRFGALLGIRFRPPVIAHVDDFVTDGTRSVLDLRLTYSQNGPPYVELIEMQGFGIYARHHGEGMHHVGVWEPACEAKLAEWEQRGLRPEAVQYTPEGRIIVAYFAPDEAHGVRLELVDEARREQMETWLQGGPWVNETAGAA